MNSAHLFWLICFSWGYVFGNLWGAALGLAIGTTLSMVASLKSVRS